MLKQKITKTIYAAITITCIIGLPSLGFLNQLFFFNHTSSMPTGLYIKTFNNNLKIGDIIVFNLRTQKSKLIKYIAAMGNDEICLDHINNFWINGIFLAQKYIQKYPIENTAQSLCQRLAKDEIFVLGEHPDSYDSRYFGVIKTTDVIASVKLLWVF